MWLGFSRFGWELGDSAGILGFGGFSWDLKDLAGILRSSAWIWEIWLGVGRLG